MPFQLREHSIINARSDTSKYELIGHGSLSCVAWGMMPLGLLLSGLIVRGTEIVLTRETALTVPFWVAAGGVFLVTLIGWRPLGSGLSGQERTTSQASRSIPVK